MTPDTPRLRLRPLREDDLELLLAIDSDPEVVRYITGGRQLPREAYVEAILPRMLSAGAEDPRLGFFVAHDRATGEALGWFHLRRDSGEPEWLELGYRLVRRSWGRGLATEGTLALMAHARALRPGVTLSARTVPENAASRRVMEKCGLEWAGTFEFPARALAGVELPSVPGVLYLARTAPVGSGAAPSMGER